MFVFNSLGFLFSCVKVKNKEFEKVDIDRDGRISLNEFHSYYENIHGKPPTNEQWFV